MEKSKERNIIIAAIVITLAALIIITVVGLAAGSKAASEHCDCKY